MVDQALEDVVKKSDLVIRIIHRTVDEEIGYPAQGLDPARNGPVRERGLQLVEQMDGGDDGLRTHDSILEQKPVTDSPSPDLKLIKSGVFNQACSIRLGRYGCVPAPWLHRARCRRARGMCRAFRFASASRRRRKSSLSCRARMRSSRDRK